MARFSDVPLDMLPLILDYLRRDEYNTLSRVSKSLNKEVIPYLYRDVKFTATRSRECARRLAYLLRTLLERPRLASHVKTFKLRGSLPCWMRYNPWPEDAARRTSAVNLWGLEDCTALSKAQKIFASNQFYQLVDESMHKSQEQFRGRNKDALAILVLTRFTQLSTLDLGDGFFMYSLFLPQILKRADRLYPELNHVVLGDKRLDPENAVSYMDLDLIRPIFYSPTVKKFEYTMSQPWQLDWNQPQAPRNENMTMLHLFRTNINRGTLDRLLSATPSLKQFYYDQEIVFDSNTPGGPPLSPYLNLDGLNIALAQLKSTLDECRLSLSMASGSLSAGELLEKGFQFPAIQGTLSILQGMRNLTKVEVPIVMFLGWVPDFAPSLHEVLPSTIQHLTLRDDLIAYCPWAVGFSCNKKIGRIADYLEQRGVHAPSLEDFRVRMKVERNGNAWLTDAVSDLGALIRGAGVSHRIEKERRADIFCWHFDKDERKNWGSRTDSVIPGMFPSTQDSLQRLSIS